MASVLFLLGTSDGFDDAIVDREKIGSTKQEDTSYIFS
jgi:hypothetical protein